MRVSTFVPVALASVVAANPLIARGDDACLAAVTGRAALGDDDLRSSHCSSFFKTIVTPAAITSTVTITGDKPAGAWRAWKRDVTVCPNEVPNYASACNSAAYTSACGKFGVTDSVTVTTLSPATVTKTVYINHGAPATCPSASATVTVTVTASATGKAGTPAAVPSACLSDEKALYFVNGFKDLLEYTSYNGTQGPPGRGYHFNTSAAILATDFTDQSDSINWMAGFPLGNVTFPSKAAFDYGQGILQPELKVTTLNVFHSCNTITWRWVAVPPTGASVQGINVMVLNSDLSKIQTNYAEFDNAAWINSFKIPSVSCAIPRAS